MWIATKHGFYSAVVHRDDPELVLVRCRVRADAQYLANAAGASVIHTPEADYPWRVLIHRSVWAIFLAREVTDMDYDNFKLAIADQDRPRAVIYGKVWDTLRLLEMT